jgi:quercetin dioxygenase-like cupin family protein
LPNDTSALIRHTGIIVSQPRPDDFHLDGLRPYAWYRDFGFAASTDGALAAHVLRFVPSYDPNVSGKRHVHDVDFQMVYLFKGWISYEFEGVGPIAMQPGNAWTQPPGIRHTVTGYSDDCELMELVMPVEYATIDVDPAGTTPDETTPIGHLLTRNVAPQRFSVSHPNDPVEPTIGFPPGTVTRDFGFSAATDGLVDGRELRFGADGTSDVITTLQQNVLRLCYVLDGSLEVGDETGRMIAMGPGSCWLELPETQRSIGSWKAGTRMFEITAHVRGRTIGD